MADALTLGINLTAQDNASPAVNALNAQIEVLTAKIAELQQAAVQGGKDWLDYTAQATGVAESLTTIASTAEDVAIKAVEISAAIAIYRRWQTVVEGVRGAYVALETALATAAAAGATAAGSAWETVRLSTVKLETSIGSLVARFAALETVASALSLAGVALTLVQVGVAADASNKQTQALTEQLGDLQRSLRLLDPASAAVQTAKARFEELYQASLRLGVSTETLLPQYKAFFDLTQNGSLTLRQSAQALTDFNLVQQQLRATSAETEAAQIQLNAALERGLVTTPQLGAIFGAALNPALAAVAKNMGITRAQLVNLIDTGQVGADKVIPALAAAANAAVAPLQNAGDAGDYSAQQFELMGIKVNDLATKALPGAANAARMSMQELTNSVDASVDPIGALVEQIELYSQNIANFGSMVVEHFKSVGEQLADSSAWSAGLKEAMYGLDLILVGAKEAIGATGESLGIMAGAAVTATDPTAALGEAWAQAGTHIDQSRDKLQTYINALEGVDDASGRTQAATQALREELKTLHEIKLPQELQDVIDKLNATTVATDAVTTAFKELGGLDFTGKSIRNLLVLRQSLQDISDRTQDATGTQAAFAVQLSNLPTAQLAALLAKITELQPRLKEAGDSGELLQTTLGAVFRQLGLDADTAGGTVTQYGQKAVEQFKLIATTATVTGTQVRSALEAALNTAKTQADVNLISAAFNQMASAGKISADLVNDGFAAIVRRTVELQNQIPGIGAAFKTLGVESAASLQLAATSAQASFEQLNAGNATIQDLQQSFLAWAKAAIEAANAANLPVPAVVRHQAAALGLGQALEGLQERYRALTPEQTAQVQATEKNARASQGYVDALEQLANAQLDGIRQEIALAQAKGETWTAQRLSVQLAKTELDWAQKLADAKRAEIAAEIAEQQAKLATKEAIENKLPADLKEIEAIRLKIAALNQQGTVIQAGQQINAEKQKQLELMGVVQQQNTQITKQNTQATNDDNAARQENIKVIDSSRESLQRTNAIIADTRAQMAALSETAKRYYDVQFTLALQQVGMEGAFEAHRKAIANFDADLSASSQKLADYAKAFNDAVALEQQGLERMAFAMNGFAKIDAAVEIASGRAQQAYYQQAAAAERLRVSIETMSVSSVTAATQLNQAARSAENGFKFLDEEDLAGLRQAIADASARMRELQEETRSAQERLLALNAEIAAERGDDATSERLKLQLEQQQALADLETKLAEARAANNKELIRLYEEQERKLQTLYTLKEKNLEQELQQQQQQQEKTETPTSTPSTASTASTTSKASGGMSSGKVYTLNLTSGNKTLTATTATDPQQFLDELTSAKNRSLA